jgi:hypothetical protein
MLQGETRGISVVIMSAVKEDNSSLAAFELTVDSREKGPISTSLGTTSALAVSDVVYHYYNNSRSDEAVVSCKAE